MADSEKPNNVAFLSWIKKLLRN